MMKPLACKVGLLSLALCLALVAACQVGPDTKPGQVWQEVQKAVAQRIVGAKSLTFSAAKDVKMVEIDHNVFKVAASVEVTKASGKHLVRPFTCIITRQRDGNWLVVQLKLEN